MILYKKCPVCKKEFDNKRRDGYFLSTNQFKDIKTCSYPCGHIFRHSHRNIYKTKGSICEVFVTGGSFLIDKKDIELVKTKVWHISYNGYVVNINNKKKAPNKQVHVVIMGKKDGLIIDHKNGIKTDNRRCNLRHVSYSENQFNTNKTKSNKINKVPLGVTFDKQSNKYKAFIRFKKDGISIDKQKLCKSLKDAIAIRTNYEKEVCKTFGYKKYV